MTPEGLFCCCCEVLTNLVWLFVGAGCPPHLPGPSLPFAPIVLFRWDSPLCGWPRAVLREFVGSVSSSAWGGTLSRHLGDAHAPHFSCSLREWLCLRAVRCLLSTCFLPLRNYPVTGQGTLRVPKHRWATSLLRKAWDSSIEPHQPTDSDS